MTIPKPVGKNIYFSYIIRIGETRRMKCTRHVARMEDYRNSQNNLVQKPERKEQFGKKPKNRWDDNIRTDRKKKSARGYGMDSCGSAHREVARVFEHGNRHGYTKRYITSFLKILFLLTSTVLPQCILR